MLIDHERKFLFIAVPKTSSISISFSLGHINIPEPPLYHQSIHSALQKHPEAAGYFKFGFVRNPWARLLSLYNDFTIKRKHQYSALIRHDKPLFGEFANFEDFCLRIHASPWMNDIFLKSQSELLGVSSEGTIADYIGRFENLHADFQYICERIGATNVQLKEMNFGEYDKSKYRTYYTDPARDAVRRLYAADVEHFGYEF